MYEDTLLGNRALRRDATVGRFYKLVEDVLDRQLEKVWDATKGRGIRGTIGQLAARATGSKKRQFQALKNELGDYIPFDSAEQFVASRFNVKPPLKSKENRKNVE